MVTSGGLGDICKVGASRLVGRLGLGRLGLGRLVDDRVDGKVDGNLDMHPFRVALPELDI